MVAARQAFGVLALLALDRATRTESRKREPFTRRDWGLLILLSWAGFALPQVLLANGIALSTGDERRAALAARADRHPRRRLAVPARAADTGARRVGRDRNARARS